MNANTKFEADSLSRTLAAYQRQESRRKIVNPVRLRLAIRCPDFDGERRDLERPREGHSKMSITIFEVLHNPESIIGFLFCTTVGVYASRGLPWFPRLLHILLAAAFSPFGDMAAHYHTGPRSSLWGGGAVACALITVGIRWRYHTLLAAEPPFEWPRGWPTPWRSHRARSNDQRQHGDDNDHGS